jgi:ComF family protein
MPEALAISKTMPFFPTSALRHVTEKTLDLLLPPLCLSCDAPVGANQALCPACWSGIHFITAPLCASCGAPFEAPVGDGMLCASCAANPPVFTAARSAMLYDDASKRLILSFKHSDRTHPAGALASWMHRAGQDFWAEADYVMPVPLHRWRLFKRRYNQSALLAQHLSIIAKKPILIDALVRLRPTPIQGRMNRKERQANVKSAFGLNQHYAEQIKGKTIVLVDDVLTTGATVNECSQVLLDAGAKAIKVLTLARVKGFG